MILSVYLGEMIQTLDILWDNDRQIKQINFYCFSLHHLHIFYINLEICSQHYNVNHINAKYKGKYYPLLLSSL